MISDPLAPPVSLPTVAPAGDASLAQVRRNVIPYEDLKAVLTPDRYLELGQDILPVLAVLAAQNPAGAKLLNADGVGNLIAAENPYVIDFLTVQTNAGGTTFSVSNPTQFLRGMAVVVGVTAVGFGLGGFWQTKVSAVNGQLLTFIEPAPVDVPAGAPVMIVSHPPAPYGYMNKAPYDWQVIQNPVPGVRATTHIDPPAHRVVKLDRVYFRARGSTTGMVSDVIVWDGTPALGATLWRSDVVLSGTTAAGATEKLENSGDVAFSHGTMTFEFDTAPDANNKQMISAAGWFIPNTS